MNKFKMKPEHQERILTAATTACELFGGIQTTFKKYEEASRMPHSRIYRKNHAMICRWDIFHAAMKHDDSLLDDLYRYLNDNHIERFLKRALMP